MKARSDRELILGDGAIRKATCEILAGYARDGRFAEHLQKVLRARKNLSARRRRLIADFCYDLVRRERTIDHLLAVGRAESGIDVGFLDPEEQLMVRFALGAMATFDVCGYDLAVAGVPEGAARIAIAVGDAAARIRGIGDEARRLAVGLSVPDWLLATLREERGGADAEALLAAMNERAPLVVRANTLKTTRDALIERLRLEEVDAEPTRWSPWGLILGRRINIRGLHAFRRGLLEAQDEGSQLIAALVDPPPGGKVVDLCAGAGGKTLALAAAMGDEGRVLASDVDNRRLGRLRPRLERSGATCVTLCAKEDLRKATRGGADRVLVDAPCSGSGTLRRKPELRWLLRSDALPALAATQGALLDEAAQLVRPGGRLIYATCSVFEAENEAVVASFLARHPAFRPRPATDLLAPELLRDGCLAVDPARHGADGFFAAALERRGADDEAT